MSLDFTMQNNAQIVEARSAWSDVEGATSLQDGFIKSGETVSSIARFDVFTDLAAAEKIWRELQTACPFTAYQHYDFAEAWFQRIGKAQRATPFIIIAYDETSQPVLLLPFILKKRGLATVAMYIGGKHANLSLPFLREGIAIAPQTIAAMLKSAATQVSLKPDIYILLNQPEFWSGARHPLAAFFSQPSVSDVYCGVMNENIEEYFNKTCTNSARKRLRNKTAKLAELGKTNIERAATPERARAMISALISQKIDSFKQKSKKADLNDSQVRAFLDEMAVENFGKDGSLETYALTVNENIVSVYAGIEKKRQGAGKGAERLGVWHAMLNSYDPDPKYARFSPGDILMRAVIRDIHSRGMRIFELGVGEARYKNAICNETINLKDSFIPVSAYGVILARIYRYAFALKKKIKQNPRFLALARKLQR